MRRFGTLTSADAQPALGQRAVEFFTDPADRAVAQFRSSEQAVSVGGAWAVRGGRIQSSGCLQLHHSK
jgi:hypothetical protein